jgi:predicted Zn-dependent protease
VFVILPWLAEIMAAPALRDPLPASVRADRLARASTFAPWDARYPTERGRVLLGIAYGDPDPKQRAQSLVDARAAFARAAGLAPRDGELQALLTRTKASQAASNPASADVSEIRSGFDRAIALEPTNANVLELVTQGWLEMGRIPEARAAALRCVDLYPDFALPMADLGVMALMEGRPKDAADTLTIALKRNWHGEEGAMMAAKSNYVAALRETRLEDVLPGASAPTPTRPSPTR